MIDLMKLKAENNLIPKDQIGAVFMFCFAYFNPETKSTEKTKKWMIEEMNCILAPLTFHVYRDFEQVSFGTICSTLMYLD